MTYRRQSGFTLIELLVVISIIALLISLLLPALGSARVTANIARDAANMKGMLTSAHNYAADNNDYVLDRPTRPAPDSPYMFANAPTDPTAWGAITGAQIVVTSSGAMSPNTTFICGLGLLFPKGPNATGSNPLDTYGDYSNIEMSYSPLGNQRDATRNYPPVLPSMWARRAYFGDEYSVPWTEDGANWGPYFGNGNYYTSCSYLFRGADYTWFDPAVNSTRFLSYQTATLGDASPTVYAKFKANRKRGLSSSEFWGAKAVMSGGTLNFYGAVSSQFRVNTGRGDGSVRALSDSNYITRVAAGTNTALGGARSWYFDENREHRYLAWADYTQGW